MRIHNLLLIAICIVSCSKTNDCKTNLNDLCLCNKIYAPVCGCNNLDYGNPCMAECVGITEYTKGPCTSKYIGKWKMIATYTDPGDGSGDFKPIDSDLIAEIKTNGEVVSYGPICYMNQKSGKQTISAIDFFEKKIVSEECLDKPIYVSLDEEHLIFRYTNICKESCLSKFQKVN